MSRVVYSTGDLNKLGTHVIDGRAVMNKSKVSHRTDRRILRSHHDCRKETCKDLGNACTS